MGEYQVNRGVGRQGEFQGLTAQYLFLFVGGLAGVFILFVVLYMSGIPQGACILFAVVAAASVVGITFRLNRRYGPHGLMKRLSARRHPRRIIHRRSIRRLLTTYKP